jgi:transcriptional regulator with XRE-family HTH domain
VKGILRAEMTRRGITYEQLAQRLGELGVQDTAVNIRNKVARGGFSAVFFVQCLRAIRCQMVRIEPD